MSRERGGGRRLATMALIVLTACAAPGIASAKTVPLPAGAATAGQNDQFNSVACPAAGECVAVGDYTDASGAQRALVEVEANGTWIASAPDLSAIAPGNQGADLLSVACSSAGNCVAVGDYSDSSGNQQELIVTEVDGTWTAQRASLAALLSVYSDPNAELDSVTCPSAGDCIAVGSYADGSDDSQGLIETESGGTWTASPATLAGLSPDTDPGVQLLQVSCASVGNCAAVGSYDVGGQPTGLLESETGGAWTASTPDLSQLSAYATPSEVQSVSCPSAGGCTAVGYYLDTGGVYEGLLVSQSGSDWQPATEAVLPADAAAATNDQDDLFVNSISCASAGDCTAVGTYDGTASNYAEGLELTETGGKWAPGLEASLPATSNPEIWLASVACTAPQHCEAAGSFEGSNGDNEELIARQSGSSWTTASVEQALPYDTGYLNDSASVACAPDAYCTAAGYSQSNSSPYPDSLWLLAAPNSASSPSVTIKGTTAQVAWSAPADTGGLPITGYSVLANDLTNTGRGGQIVSVGASHSATFTDLNKGDTYTFTVSALNVLGSGIPATTASVVAAASKKQIRASLAALLTPKGAAARLRSLRRKHGYTFIYKALESGKVAVRWYQITGRGRHTRKHLVASGSARPRRAGSVKVHVRLTALGRRLVRSSKRLRLTARVSFTGHGLRVRRTHRFTLR